MPKTEFKYLADTIDKHLQWDRHITYTIKKMQTILYKFKYLRNIFNSYQLRILYLVLVENYLRYGIGVVCSKHIYIIWKLFRKDS